MTKNGGCQQFCIPSENNNRVCACSVGYKKELDIKCTPHTSFAVVSQVDLVRGYSLSNTLDAIVPISGPGKIIIFKTIHKIDLRMYIDLTC